MILDAIIGLFVSLFGFLVEAAAAVVSPIYNLMIAPVVELVVGIFVSGFTIGRIDRKKNKKRDHLGAIIGTASMLICAGALSYLLVWPAVSTKEITFVAKDGHSLPFAALVIHTNNGDEHERTDNAGNIVISRYQTRAITIKDPRYLEKTWNKEDIRRQLIVERSRLGSGLDKVAGELMKKLK